jgi:hypothetical protein
VSNKLHQFALCSEKEAAPDAAMLVSARFPQGDFQETVNFWARKRRLQNFFVSIFTDAFEPGESDGQMNSRLPNTASPDAIVPAQPTPLPNSQTFSINRSAQRGNSTARSRVQNPCAIIYFIAL